MSTWQDKIIILWLTISPYLLWGHRINIFATVGGNRIYTQSYASDGSKVKGGLIEVYDKNGNKLLTGKTDSLGEFSFVIPKKDDLKIVVLGGMGHRAETIIGADELPEIKEKIAPKLKKEGHKEVPRAETLAVDTTLLKRIVEEAVEAKIHPLIRMIAEEKRERIGFNEVIGGIGYIIGIIGIVAFFMKRKRNV